MEISTLLNNQRVNVETERKFPQYLEKNKNKNSNYHNSGNTSKVVMCLHFIYLKNFFPIYLIYLFIYFGCVRSLLLRTGFLQLWQVGATLHCGARASHCGGFSCCGARALGARGLQQLQHVGLVVVACGFQSASSVVVVHRLSCSAACGIFPDQGTNPCPLHWQVDS